MSSSDQVIERARSRIRNPLTAIRAFCISCMGGLSHFVPGCTAHRCPLFAYRMGKDPRAKKRGRPFKIVESSLSGSANSEAGELKFEEWQTGEAGA